MAKVVIFAPKYPPDVGGAAVYFEQVVRALESTEYDVTVFAPENDRRPPVYEEYGAAIYRCFPELGAPAYAGLFYLRELWQRLKDVNPDIAHVHPHFPQYRHFRWLLKTMQIPRVYDCRDKEFSRRYVKDGNEYLSVNGEVDGILRNEVGASKDQIMRSPVVVPDVDAESTDLAGKPSVAFVGELTERKGIKTAAKATSRIDGAHLHVAGVGELQDWLAKRVETIPATYHGRLEHSNAISLITSADVLCLPSETEGRPRVVVEALATGTPVVTTDVGGVVDLIGQAGEVVEKDVASVADGLRNVTQNAEYTLNAKLTRVTSNEGLVQIAVTGAYQMAFRRNH